MATKKVYKLKMWPKVLIVLLILFGIAGYFGYQKYEEYLYRQTDEYKLLEVGYSTEETKVLLDNLSSEEISEVLTYEYNEFIPEFAQAEYFIFKNLDGYLSQVITQEQDFFKYRGTEGYDYDYIVSLVNVKAIYPVYENTEETDLSLGYGILVNKYYELGADYAPDDLVDIDIRYRFGGEKQIRAEVYDAFLEMWEAANQEGIYLVIDSAYRDYASQKEVYEFYENSQGTKYADGIAARPGFSEHQTGLSLDIYSKECANAATFKDSKTYAWLVANAHKYGFILRYPDGKSELTGYEYESWHYRYLGVELATEVYERGLTYDEYYAYYIANASE